MINARSETAMIKPSFRDAMRSRRCVIPATAFYEWESRRDGRQPHALRLSNGEIMAFAGLWERWVSAEGMALETCTILTRSGGKDLEWLHDRMPVILSPSTMNVWLDSQANASAIELLLADLSSPELDVRPVSRKVNSPEHDGPDLLAEIPDSLFPN